MRVLLTCAGRRSYFVEYFKELENVEEVYVVNSTEISTAVQVADKGIIAPSIYSETYIDFLIEHCLDYNIRLIVSLFDLELPLLAKNKERFQEMGITVAVSTPKVVEICNDKWKSFGFINHSTSLNTPLSTLKVDEAKGWIKDDQAHFPLFIKPRFGTGSIAVQQAETIEEVDILYKKVKRSQNASYLRTISQKDKIHNVIIQSDLKGSEYGLDVVNDFDGNYQTTFVKKKFAMRSGETDGAVTVEEPVLEQAGKEIAEKLSHVGNLDVDLFYDGSDISVLELNPRFGGGYPFSHLAGANLPAAYVAWAQNEKTLSQYLSIETGVKGLKNIGILKMK